jgi:hypothetical protein
VNLQKRALRLSVLLEKRGDLAYELFYVAEVVPNDLIQLGFRDFVVKVYEPVSVTRHQPELFGIGPSCF